MDFLRRVLAAVSTLFKLPDVQDSAAVRRFVQTVLGFVASAADWTPTQIDDEAVIVVQKLVADDETWAAIHAFIVGRLANEPVIALSGEAGELASMVLGVYGEDSDD